MSKAPKISVLVPIYNVEAYLRQCLETLVNQTLTDLEIICINDGSTDGSTAIIQEFQKSDSRIRVISKKNTGYGDSMNQGLKKANGEYIAIVEPDDFIDLDAFEKLYNYAHTYNAEVVRANYYFNKNNKDTKFSYIEPSSAGHVVNPHRQAWIFFQAPAIWSAIYRRDFLNQNKIRFLPTPGASYQDTGFNFKVWASATRAYFTTEAFLHYRIDNESSSVNNPGKVMNVCYEYEEIEKYLRKQGFFDDLAPLMQTAKFGAYYWNLLRLSPKLLPDFVTRVKEEYTLAEQNHLLLKEYFDPFKWSLIQYILSHSTTQIIHRLHYIKFRLTLHERIHGLSRSLYLKTHPTYRQQQKVAALIDELEVTIDLLQTKIQNMEKKS